MPTLLLFFSGALAQFLVPGRASLSNDDDTNLHYYLYLLSVRIPFTLDGGVRTMCSTTLCCGGRENETASR